MPPPPPRHPRCDFNPGWGGIRNAHEPRRLGARNIPANSRFQLWLPRRRSERLRTASCDYLCGLPRRDFLLLFQSFQRLERNGHLDQNHQAATQAQAPERRPRPLRPLRAQLPRPEVGQAAPGVLRPQEGRRSPAARPADPGRRERLRRSAAGADRRRGRRPLARLQGRQRQGLHLDGLQGRLSGHPRPAAHRHLPTAGRIYPHRQEAEGRPLPAHAGRHQAQRAVHRQHPLMAPGTGRALRQLHRQPRQGAAEVDPGAGRGGLRRPRAVDADRPWPGAAQAEEGHPDARRDPGGHHRRQSSTRNAASTTPFPSSPARGRASSWACSGRTSTSTRTSSTSAASRSATARSPR